MIYLLNMLLIKALKRLNKGKTVRILIGTPK